MRVSVLACLSTLVTILVACGDDTSTTTQSNDPETSAPTETTEPETDEPTPDEPAPLGPLADVEATPGSTVGVPPSISAPIPQPEAWSELWTRTLSDPAGRALGIRYLADDDGAAVIAVFETSADSALVDAEGASEALPGEGRRLIAALLDPNDAELIAGEWLALADDEEVGDVTKAPGGFAVGLAGGSGPTRVVVAQTVGGGLRVVEVTALGSHLALPASADLAMATRSGADTALALQLTAGSRTPSESAGEEPGIIALSIAVGEAAIELVVAGAPEADGVAFLTLAPPSEESSLPAEGTTVAYVEGLVASSVVETRLGPVVTAHAARDVLIRDDKIVAGDQVLLIGALPTATSDDSDDDDGVVPVVLWSGDPASVEVTQIASSGSSGLVLAGVGAGDLSIGDDVIALEPGRAFVATLGSGGGFVYTAPECDRIMALSAGFQYRLVKHACDAAGVGPALTLTLVGRSDIGFGGEESEPVDVVIAPLAEDASVASLAGILALFSGGERIYGGLFDLGDGPRVMAARGDGQTYDTGVIEALAGYDGGDQPLIFQLLRQGGFGGGGGGTNNAVIYAIRDADGPRLGRALVNFVTRID